MPGFLNRSETAALHASALPIRVCEVRWPGSRELASGMAKYFVRAVRLVHSRPAHWVNSSPGRQFWDGLEENPPTSS